MKNAIKIKSLGLLALGLSLTLAHGSNTEKEHSTGAPYPLKTCIVSDEVLDADGVNWTYEGREIQLCCKGCKKDFLKDPAPYLEKLDAAYVKAYPLKYCVVSKEDLGGMGGAYVHHHEGQVVLFCCKGCVKKFNKDPEAYLGDLRKAYAEMGEKTSSEAPKDAGEHGDHGDHGGHKGHNHEH